MDRQKTILGSVVVCAIALCTAWAMGWFAESKYNDDPEVAKVEKLRDEILKKGEQQKKESRGQIREAIGKMSEEQRASFMESSMPIFVKMGAMRMEKRFDELMSMSAEEQRREFDKKIDEQIAREKERNAKKEGDRSRRGPPKMSAEKMDEFRKKMQDWTTPEQRAKFQTIIGMYNQRRAERGLEPIDMGRWR
ncbi:MAG: hypothetical protein CMJ72_07385 [Planctomycetaceae bacterium]|nr:hypothetical protein [Planctomycetaceae bacterium]